MTPVDLCHLAIQLEQLGAPSRSVDAMLWDLIDPRPRFALPGDLALYKQDPASETQFDCAPEYTADLNLACVLLQKLFPGREADLTLKPNLTACEVTLWHPDDLMPGDLAELIAEPSARTARTSGPAAVALCHAIVKALIAERKAAAIAA